VGTESVDPEIAAAACRLRVADYCRAIESYLCQKNDGHLIRIVGPSFDLVSGWATDGVPVKVAFRGIDRYVERYYRKGPRRRPVRIDFCESDVLDVFEEWRRAVGLTAAHEPDADETGGEPARERRGTSLPAHLERVVRRLTSARVNGTLGAPARAASGVDDLDNRDQPPGLDDFIDRMSRELDEARAATRGLRGEARRALIDRLARLDRELLQVARNQLTDSERQTLEKEAEGELAGFRDAMPEAAYQRAREAAMDRLVRERARLPIVTFS
jgi:hypothetical protein